MASADSSCAMKSTPSIRATTEPMPETHRVWVLQGHMGQGGGLSGEKGPSPEPPPHSVTASPGPQLSMNVNLLSVLSQSFASTFLVALSVTDIRAERKWTLFDLGLRQAVSPELEMPLPCPPSHSYLSSHPIFSTPIPPHHLPSSTFHPLPVISSPLLHIPSLFHLSPLSSTLLGSRSATVARLLGEEKATLVPTFWDP